MLARILGLLVLGQTESLPALINDTAAAVESLPRPVPHPAAADATSRILGMDPTLFWGLVGAVVGVVGIIAAVCLYRRTAGKRQVEDVQKDMATKDQVEGVRKEMCARIDAISTALGAQLYADGLPSASPSVRDPFKLGLTAMEQYKWDEAIGHFKDALKHASGTQLVGLFNLIGLCHDTPGRWPEALEDWEESERLARQFGDRKGEAASLGNIGLVWGRKGELDKALGYHKKALVVFEELGAKQEQAQSLGNIGLVWQNKGDLDKALGYLQKALDIQVEIGDKFGQARQLGNIGLIWQARAEGAPKDAAEACLDKALECQQRSQAISVEGGYREGAATALLNMGSIFIHKQDWDKAVACYVPSLMEHIAMGIADGPKQCLSGLRMCYTALGEGRFVELCVEAGMEEEEAEAMVRAFDKKKPDSAPAQ